MVQLLSYIMEKRSGLDLHNLCVLCILVKAVSRIVLDNALGAVTNFNS